MNCWGLRVCVALQDRKAFLAMLRGAQGLSIKVRRFQGAIGWKLQLNSLELKTAEFSGWYHLLIVYHCYLIFHDVMSLSAF